MRYVILTFLLYIRLFPPGAPVAVAESTEGLAVLRVSVFDEAGVPASVVKSAETQASQIFRQAGIRVAWLNCPQEGVGSIVLVRCDEANFPGHLHLHLLRASRGLNPATLGVAFLSSYGPGCCADLFYASVTALAVSSAIPEPVVLGAAMAHELGHLLLGTNSHAVGGLMRAHWDWESLQAAERNELLFLRPEATRIRNRFPNSPAMQVCVIDSRQQAAVESSH